MYDAAQSAHLQANSHDNIRLALLGLIRFDTWVYKCHKLIEDGLHGV